jgi:hypothetical protein
MASLAVIQEFATGEPELKQRFLAARLQAAWDVLVENGGVPASTRLDWAKKIFETYTADGDKEYRWFLSHTAVQTTGKAISDANMVIAVKSFINAWAA